MYYLNLPEKCIINGNDGQLMRPPCINDVIALHAYLIGSGESQQAQQLLSNIFNGEKVITNMLEKIKSCGL